MKLDAIDIALSGVTVVAVLAAVLAMHIIRLDIKPRACSLTELIQRTSIEGLSK